MHMSCILYLEHCRGGDQHHFITSGEPAKLLNATHASYTTANDHMAHVSGAAQQAAVADRAAVADAAAAAEVESYRVCHWCILGCQGCECLQPVPGVARRSAECTARWLIRVRVSLRNKILRIQLCVLEVSSVLHCLSVRDKLSLLCCSLS